MRFLLLPIFCCLQLFAASNPLQEEKLVEVDLSHIHFQEDGMYYANRDGSFEINALAFQDGKYLASIKILGVWFCPACEKMNSRFDEACIYCGEPRQDWFQ